jgi:hypothetical protein
VIRIPKLSRTRLLAALFLAAIFAAPGAEAQAPSLEPAQIVLPARLVASQPATLAVLDNLGRLVAKANLTLSDGTAVETDATGRAFFNAPPIPGVLIARIAGHHEIAAASVILPFAKSEKTQIDWAPAQISIHDRFDVRGSGFRGDAAGNAAQLGHQPALILAASPASLVLLLDLSAPPGTAQLSVTANGSEAVAILAALAIEFDTSGANLSPGAKAALTVRIRGTDQPKEMEVENLTPAVLQFARGVSEHVRTKGGVDNSAQITVRAMHPGDFSFRVRLSSTDPNSIDTEAAHAYLLAAQKIAPTQLAKRLDPLLTRLEQKKPETKKIQQDLTHLLSTSSTENAAFLITAARDALLPK